MSASEARSEAMTKELDMKAKHAMAELEEFRKHLNEGAKELPDGQRFELVWLPDGNLFVKPLDVDVQ